MTSNLCVKCEKNVPLGYLNGEIDDDLWAECIHTGWYCPNHSPTNNCGDDECPLCNVGYDCESEEDSVYSDCSCSDNNCSCL